MPYLIRRIDQGGGYVAPPGSPKSYTHSKYRARVFDTYAAADSERCPGNEIVVEV